MPPMPRGGFVEADRCGPTYASGRLRELPHAEAAHGGCRTCGCGGQLHPAPKAGGRSACRATGAGRRISRARGSVLSKNLAAYAGKRSVPGCRAGEGGKQSDRGNRATDGGHQKIQAGASRILSGPRAGARKKRASCKGCQGLPRGDAAKSAVVDCAVETRERSATRTAVSGSSGDPEACCGG